MIRGPFFFSTSTLPVPERLVLKGGSRHRVPLQVRVGYFHHPLLGHTLIDTGYSARLARKETGGDWLLAAYCRLLNPTTLSPDPLGDGLARLGIGKRDIETVILTHFHADHISGLANLPACRILSSEKAWKDCHSTGRLKNAMHGVFPSLLPMDFEDRLRLFEQMPAPDGIATEAPHNLGPALDITGDGSVLIVDLPGHLGGHVGVCFPLLPRPLLYATDAQWMLDAILQDRVPGFPASLVAHNSEAAAESIRRIRSFAEAGGEVMLCHEPRSYSHDIEGSAPA